LQSELICEIENGLIITLVATILVIFALGGWVGTLKD
jgi:hypothetical protein